MVLIVVGCTLLVGAALLFRSAKRWFSSVILSVTARLGKSDEGGTLRILFSLAKGFGWLLVVLVILATLGVNVTALLTGLGIGGIAVALAVQSVLGDLLASIAILLDKPFVVGEFIVVGDAAGAVEAIGLKNTRLRAVTGEVCIVPNADLVKSRIRNFQRLEERRVAVTLPIQVGDSVAVLRRVPSLIGDVISTDSRWRCERVSCVEWGKNEATFEVVLHLRAPDYGAFIEAKHELFTTLQERLFGEGITLTSAAKVNFSEKIGAVL
jgi:small-conductance mechanosensitive channel